MQVSKQVDKKEWLTVRDLMDEFCIGRTTAYSLTKKIPIKRIGGSIRINRRELEEFLDNNQEVRP